MFVIYVLFFFFFNDTATTEIYTYLHTLSLHDALPIFLAALAPVSMLAVVPSGWYPFGPVKWLVVSVLVAAGSAVVLRTGEVHLPRSIRVAVKMLLAAVAARAVVRSEERRVGKGGVRTCRSRLLALNYKKQQTN